MGKPRNCCASNRIAQPLARQRNAAAPHIRVLLNAAPTQPFQKNAEERRSNHITFRSGIRNAPRREG